MSHQLKNDDSSVKKKAKIWENVLKNDPRREIKAKWKR